MAATRWLQPHGTRARAPCRARSWERATLDRSGALDKEEIKRALDDLEIPGDEVSVETLSEQLLMFGEMRNMPALVCECPAIPYTNSGKKVEIAVARALQGRPVTNLSSLENPESVQFFEANAEKLDEIAM